jgi:hypothetical protein
MLSILSVYNISRAIIRVASPRLRNIRSLLILNTIKTSIPIEKKLIFLSLWSFRADEDNIFKNPNKKADSILKKR